MAMSSRVVIITTLKTISRFSPCSRVGVIACAAPRAPRGARAGRARARRQLSLLIMSNSGMYMEMTMPPTVVPRKKIMTGSMRVRRLATAWSTSSS